MAEELRVQSQGHGPERGPEMRRQDGRQEAYRRNSTGQKRTFNFQNRSRDSTITLRFYFHLVSYFRASGLCVLEIMSTVAVLFLFSNGSRAGCIFFLIGHLSFIFSNSKLSACIFCDI